MTREERELAIEELQGCIIAEEHGKDGKPNGNVTCELTKDTIDLAIKALEQEPRKGHWIEVTNGRGGHECDVCHDYAPSFQNGNEYLSTFCPNCGADMRGNENECNS